MAKRIPIGNTKDINCRDFVHLNRPDGPFLKPGQSGTYDFWAGRSLVPPAKSGDFS